MSQHSLNKAASAQVESHAVSEQAKGAGREPLIWLVLSDKRGDNGQVERIAAALDLPFERKVVRMKPPYVLGKPAVTPSLHHIDSERSDPLAPPWPDLIVTIGRRPSMVALWVREQSGGRTKIVFVGKPSCPLERFDLVVQTAEIQLPPVANIMPAGLPLMRADEAAVAAAADAWRPRFEQLSHPLVALLVGGPTSGFVYDDKVIDRLAAIAADVLAQGGTPYVTTSRRTGQRATERLKASLPEGAQFFEWQAEARDNPYLGLLGLADGFVVTADSISMMVEIVRLQKPLAIFPLPSGKLGALDQARRRAIRWLFAPEGSGAGNRLRRALARLLYRLGIATQTRDFRGFQSMLIDQGLAVPAGQPFKPPRAAVADESQRVAARIKALALDTA